MEEPSVSEQVLATIPHRPPFLFLDRILEVTQNGAVAERVIRADEPHFAGHYPGNPIMPGVLLCEACFQCAAVYMVERFRKAEATVTEEWTPVLARIGDAKFKQMVKPGDCLRIEVEYKENLSRFHFMRGKILKNGRIAMTVEFGLAMLENSDS